MSSKLTSADAPLSAFYPAEFAKLGQRQADTFFEMQRKLFDLVQQANRDWAARAELERELAVDLAAKLSSAKTLPDLATVYQEWLRGHLAVSAEDGRKFLANNQELVAFTTRLFANGAQHAAG